MTHPFGHLFGNLVPPGTLTAADPPEFQERTTLQQANHEAFVAALGTFESKAVKRSPIILSPGEFIEWDLLLNKEAPGKWVGQNSGSCIGTNCFNALMIWSLIEAIIKQTGERKFLDYFWPVPYGYGRHFGGMDDEGEGSYLSVQVKAFTEIGIPQHDSSADFPQYEERDGARWLAANVEKWWARQKNFGTKYNDAADDHLVLDGGMIPCGPTNWQDAMQQLILASDDGPVLYAGMMGWTGTKIDDGLKLVTGDDRWPHCMFFCGKGNHPKHGLCFKVGNFSWLPSDFSWGWATEKRVVKIVKESYTELAVVRDFAGMAGIDIQWLIELILRLSGTV